MDFSLFSHTCLGMTFPRINVNLNCPSHSNHKCFSRDVCGQLSLRASGCDAESCERGTWPWSAAVCLSVNFCFYLDVCQCSRFESLLAIIFLTGKSLFLSSLSQMSVSTWSFFELISFIPFPFFSILGEKFSFCIWIKFCFLIIPVQNLTLQLLDSLIFLGIILLPCLLHLPSTTLFFLWHKLYISEY